MSAAGKDRLVAYDFKLIRFSDELSRTVLDAIDRTGRWEEFIELRMAAGPTVSLTAPNSESESFAVDVTWGSQRATADVIGLVGALEVADRLAYEFYKIRSEGPRQKD